MPISTNVPTLTFLAVTDVASTLSFSAQQGAIYILNSGSNTCWLTLDGSVPVASNAAGRLGLIGGASINLDDIVTNAVKAICAAGLTTTLSIVGVQRPGDNSGGLQ